MKYLVSLLDHRTNSYGPPAPVTHIQEAVRSYRVLVNEPNPDRQTMPAKFPSDFSLMVIGEFEEETGLLRDYPENIKVTVLDELKAAAPLTPMKGQ